LGYSLRRGRTRWAAGSAGGGGPSAKLTDDEKAQLAGWVGKARICKTMVSACISRSPGTGVS
jgi:hypothetical protein